jgi:hypothetical protein
MSTETADTDLDAAFEAGYDAEAPEQDAPAPTAAAPASPAADATTPETTQGDKAPEDDELAGLPPKVRAMLAEFESIKQAAALVPTLEHKLRSAEGRVAALQKAMPAPPPPAPPRLDKVERVRAELPEVVEAIEEYAQHLLKPAGKPSEDSTAATPQPDADDPALVLDKVAPDWRATAAQPAFEAWLKDQGADYHARIAQTTNPADMLDAVTKFKVHANATQRQNEDAARLARTRQTRAAAAAVPSGAGRRSPTPPSTLDDEFEAGFRS